MQNRVIKFLTGRITCVCVLIVIQLIAVMILTYSLESSSFYIDVFFKVAGFFLIVCISNKNQNPAFILAWSLLILFFPVSGVFFYLLVKKRKREKFVYEKKRETVNFSEQCPKNILSVFKCINFLSGAEVYCNTDTEFYSCGEMFYPCFLEKLSSAKHYIYMEYFIISNGTVWCEIYDIIKKKAQKGVDIRILFDDMCCGIFDKKYRKKLESEGIYTTPFNKLFPFPGGYINYRDHRKIAVIDGETAFTGGINIADEYMNRKRKYGYWKDSALMICGDAVSEMEKMFTDMWNKCSEFKVPDKYESRIMRTVYFDKGYVQPFCSVPSDDMSVSEMSYIKLINNASDYIYITTPYLIPDREMITSLSLAASSGVDVRIVTPYIPDKWYVQIATRSNYKKLIENGVRIYEYMPGFIHSKTIVSDDVSGIVGTANFDFRSFYFLFENGVLMYKTKAIFQMKEDFKKLVGSSMEIDENMCNNIPFYKKLLSAFFRLIQPLM